MRNLLLILSLFGIIFTGLGSFGAQKPFKRALIISGGGVVPGLGLGYLAGAQEMGWKPDVIIATCGAALPTVVNDKFENIETSLEFLKSETYFKALSKIRVVVSTLLTLKDKFAYLREKPNLIPDFFTGYALSVPTYFDRIFSENTFKYDTNKPRVIILSARAHFHRADVGRPRVNLMKFTQVFMTDKDTGTYLEGYKSPLKNIVRTSNIEAETEVMTYMSPEVALRASVADPILMEPLMYGPDYYFTGASDLYPIELAHFLADEVVATYPMGRFSDFEEEAFKSTFGISQQERALTVIKDQSIKWIDQTEFPKDASFDPYPEFLFLKSGLPQDLETYQENIERQYEFGRTRMIEALSLKQGQGLYLNHIRSPIDKIDSKVRNGSGFSL